MLPAAFKAQARRSVTAPRAALSIPSSSRHWHTLPTLSSSSSTYSAKGQQQSTASSTRSFLSLSRGYATATAATNVAAVPSKPLPTKILIANRGEIACRVMRTCRKLGVKTVAVFSEPDRHAMHVKMADEAYCIGPAASAESYLRMDKIIEVAKKTGAQMIHPGYGFLSENSQFAKALARENIEFIGPPASAIEAMGSKSASKEIMIAAGVPCVPGYHGSGQSVELLKQEADKCGYPVLIKAVKGGGGKGMKVVMHASEFEEQLDSARREALKSFGDTDVLIEKYLQRPRHVEVQVFCDKHGNAVYVWERDCSVQRRHQKIIEEAPAPGLAAFLRKELGEKAVAAARAVNYVGAGTVEFILDAETLEFFFMEMNTRLQVEHPVSEMISGLDLVEWQLEVASGNQLPLDQDQIPLDGHAFEARIYAENTRAGFLPDVGTLQHVCLPSTSETVRVDTGFETGDEISVHYDPMIAKLIVKGRDRNEALRVLTKALEQYQIVGPHTNIDFLKNLTKHPKFIQAKVETGFIPMYGHELLPELESPSSLAIAQTALFRYLKNVKQQDSLMNRVWSHSNFTGLRVMNTQSSGQTFTFLGSNNDNKEDLIQVTVTPTSEKTFSVSILNGPQFNDIEAKLSSDGKSISSIGIQQTSLTTTVIPTLSSTSNPSYTIFINGESIKLYLPHPNWYTSLTSSSSSSNSSDKVISPMPSKIVDVKVKPGQNVLKGDILLVLEAMKTEHILRSPRDGIIEKVHSKAKIGEMVSEGLELITFQQEEPVESKE